MTRAEALAELGLSPAADDVAVKAAYRRLAQERHPDKGGDAAAFHRLHEAYQVARRPPPPDADLDVPCPECRGRGTVEVRRGWARVQVLCDACGGTGRASYLTDVHHKQEVVDVEAQGDDDGDDPSDGAGPVGQGGEGPG